ncbi:MAG TPA: aldo/keto reductase [Devosia sp.]|nr:aldo/keto reductase [Devosia sp.]
MTAATKIAFDKSRLARADLDLPRFGLGTASLAGNFVDVPPEQARLTVTHALERGLTYFDTAPQYGLGRGEHFVGDALRYRREGTVLSTKVGGLLKPVLSDAQRTRPHNWAQPFPFEIGYDYSYGAIMRSWEDSLQRLGLAAVDILYVHDIGSMTHGAEAPAKWEQLTTGGGYRALQELKAGGAIKAIGIGVNEFQVLLDALELGDWDVFLLAGRYTLLDQSSLSFLETCRRRGVAVVAAAPFNGGALMGNGTWNYAKAPPEIADRVRRLEAFCAEHRVPVGAAALQFPMAHPAVTTMLPGPKSPAELDGLLDWWQVEIPAAFWDDLAKSGLLEAGTPLPNGRSA